MTAWKGFYLTQKTKIVKNRLKANARASGTTRHLSTNAKKTPGPRRSRILAMANLGDDLKHKPQAPVQPSTLSDEIGSPKTVQSVSAAAQVWVIPGLLEQILIHAAAPARWRKSDPYKDDVLSALVKARADALRFIL